MGISSVDAKCLKRITLAGCRPLVDYDAPQRYAHLSHDTLLAATNSVNTALGGMFMPMVSASSAAQVKLVQ